RHYPQRELSLRPPRPREAGAEVELSARNDGELVDAGSDSFGLKLLTVAPPLQEHVGVRIVRRPYPALHMQSPIGAEAFPSQSEESLVVIAVDAPPRHP